MKPKPPPPYLRARLAGADTQAVTFTIDTTTLHLPAHTAHTWLPALLDTAGGDHYAIIPGLLDDTDAAEVEYLLAEGQMCGADCLDIADAIATHLTGRPLRQLARLAAAAESCWDSTGGELLTMGQHLQTMSLCEFVDVMTFLLLRNKDAADAKKTRRWIDDPLPHLPLSEEEEQERGDEMLAALLASPIARQQGLTGPTGAT